MRLVIKAAAARVEDCIKIGVIELFYRKLESEDWIKIGAIVLKLELTLVVKVAAAEVQDCFKIGMFRDVLTDRIVLFCLKIVWSFVYFVCCLFL